MSSFDGMWVKVIVTDANNCPLTAVEVNRKLGHDVTSIKKPELISFIENELEAGCITIDEVYSFSEEGIKLDEEKKKKKSNVNASNDTRDAIQLPCEIASTVEQSLLEEIEVINREINLHVSCITDDEELFMPQNIQPDVEVDKEDGDEEEFDPILSYHETKVMRNCYMAATGRKKCSYPDFLNLLARENFDQKISKPQLKQMVSHVEDKMKEAGCEINWNKSKIEIINCIRNAAGLKSVQVNLTSKQSLNRIKKSWFKSRLLLTDLPT